MATGTTVQVIQAFLNGRAMDSHGSARSRLTFDTLGNPDGGADLVSYATVVARMLPDGRLAVSPDSYSATTAKLLGQLLRAYLGNWRDRIGADGQPDYRQWVTHAQVIARVDELTPIVPVYAGGRAYSRLGNGMMPFAVIER